MAFNLYPPTEKVKEGSICPVKNVKMGEKKDGSGNMWQGVDLQCPESEKAKGNKGSGFLHVWVVPPIPDLRDNDEIQIDEVSVIHVKMRESKEASAALRHPFWYPSPELDIRAHKVSSGGGGFTTTGFDTRYKGVDVQADDVNTDGELPF